MYYTTDTNEHGLAHDPFKAIVAPRPIGWIGTQSEDGVPNLGPYSFFNAVCDHPKMVMFSSSGVKDSVINAQQTGEFTTSFVSLNLAERMNLSSVEAPPDIDEFAYSGLSVRKGILVSAPFVDEAYAALECKVTQIFKPPTLSGLDAENTIVIGEVVAVHIDEAVVAEGRFDVAKARPVARLGYRDYCSVSSAFEMIRPCWGR